MEKGLGVFERLKKRMLISRPHAKKVFLFFAHGSRLVADLILKNSVFHLFIEAKIKAKLATDVICNER